ncbi:MAG: hypothetical protein HDR00_07500 [Lachnospiraceae bacterium]|nr:hypothetical protein [Lachnospiraceae bacterium]
MLQLRRMVLNFLFWGKITYIYKKEQRDGKIKCSGWGYSVPQGKKSFCFSYAWLSIEFFLTARSNSQGEQPRMAVQPSRGMDAALTAARKLRTPPTGLLEKTD